MERAQAPDSRANSRVSSLHLPHDQAGRPAIIIIIVVIIISSSSSSSSSSSNSSIIINMIITSINSMYMFIIMIPRLQLPTATRPGRAGQLALAIWCYGNMTWYANVSVNISMCYAMIWYYMTWYYMIC